MGRCDLYLAVLGLYNRKVKGGNMESLLMAVLFIVLIQGIANMSAR